ncbi:MAG TPA: hypothetical protein VHP36_00385 [Chitinispirillaceae bacterium]|nr:hypothetical protein [Chitinispirillaceae bacterium]
MKNQQGSALIAVLVIGIIGFIISTIMFRSTKTSINRTADRRVDVILLNIAEAGKEHALAFLKSGQINLTPNTRTQIVQNSNFNGGTYTVSCSSTTVLDTLWLYSEAKYERKKKSIETAYTIIWASSPSAAYDKSIAVGGSITWSGTGWLNAGKGLVHCNKTYSMNGSSDITAFIVACGGLERKGACSIFGDVWSTWISEIGSGLITGTKNIGTIDTIIIPTINTNPYYQHALANGQVFNSDKHISGSTSFYIPGDIMWVNGNFKRSGTGDFFGCIIATGDIEIAGGGNYNKVQKYPLALSINGKIDFSGSGNVHGLLFAMNGDFEMTGSGNVTGSVICKGDLRKTGSWNFLTYEKSAPQPPGITGNEFNLISWREL